MTKFIDYHVIFESWSLDINLKVVETSGTPYGGFSSRVIAIRTFSYLERCEGVTVIQTFRIPKDVKGKFVLHYIFYSIFYDRRVKGEFLRYFSGKKGNVRDIQDVFEASCKITSAAFSLMI